MAHGKDFRSHPEHEFNSEPFRDMIKKLVYIECITKKPGAQPERLPISQWFRTIPKYEAAITQNGSRILSDGDVYELTKAVEWYHMKGWVEEVKSGMAVTEQEGKQIKKQFEEYKKEMKRRENARKSLLGRMKERAEDYYLAAVCCFT